LEILTDMLLGAVRRRGQEGVLRITGQQLGDFSDREHAPTPSEFCCRTTEPGNPAELSFALTIGVMASPILLTYRIGCFVVSLK
jgi:hypothetical protein